MFDLQEYLQVVHERKRLHRILNDAKEKLWDTYSSLDDLVVKIKNMNLPPGVQNIK